MRGFACLLVLVVHTSAIIFPPTADFLSGCGKIGVWLFFVLSAFLLTYQFEGRGFKLSSLADYAAGRFLRIIPAFVVAIVLYRIFGTADVDTWDDVKAALLLQHAYDHLWTIPVEFKAYAVVPVFAAAFLGIRASAGATGVAVGLLVAIALHQWMFPYTELKANSIDTIWYLPSFLMGSAAAVLLPKWRGVAQGLTSAIAWTALAAVALVTPAFEYLAFGWPASNVLMNKFLYFSLVWMLFILSVLANDNGLRRIFSGRFFRLIGTWSYSIYLLHWYFLVKFSSWERHYLAAILGCTAAIAAGAVLHVTVERPSEALRKRVRKWLETRQSSRAARLSEARTW